MFHQKPLWTQDQFGTRSKCYLWNPDKRGDVVNNVDIFLLAELFRSWLLIKEHKSKMAGRPDILNSALLYHFFSDYRILPTLTKHRNALLCFSNKRFYTTLKSIQPLAQCDIWVTLAVAFGRYAGINKSMMWWMLQLDDDDSQGRYWRKGTKVWAF